MAKFSELTAITSITDSDLMMITDAETSASKKITWDNVRGSIGPTLTFESDENNGTKLILSQSNDGTDAPHLHFKKARGTTASPTAVASSDVMGALNAYGYNGSAYIQGGNFRFLASDDAGNSTFELKTRVANTLGTRIRVDTNGHVDIGSGLTWTPRTTVTPLANGELTVEATNDTTLTFKYKGSDGTVRTGTLTLS